MIKACRRLTVSDGRVATAGVAAVMTVLATIVSAAPRQAPGAHVDAVTSMEVPGGMAAFSRVIGIDPTPPTPSSC